MTAQEAMKRLLRDFIHEPLAGKGFLKNREYLMRTCDECWMLVHVQRSTRSTRDCILFTINLGIVYKLILDARNIVGFEQYPNFDYYSWRRRLGDYWQPGEDPWWEVRGENDVERIGLHVRTLLFDEALPEMEAIATARSLRDSRSLDTSDLRSVSGAEELLILFARLGPREQAQPLLERLRKRVAGTPWVHDVERLAERLGLGASPQ